MEKDSYLRELYLTHALNSQGISSWGDEFVPSHWAGIEKQDEAGLELSGDESEHT